jgi:hypothetical protein
MKSRNWRETGIERRSDQLDRTGLLAEHPLDERISLTSPVFG